jgi:predicted small lipoprotein YifL
MLNFSLCMFAFSPMRLLLVVLLASALLQGCGLKGPLYLATPEEEREMAERKEQLEQRRQREKQERQQAEQARQQQQ